MISIEDNAKLTIPFSIDEFRQAAFQMHQDKRSGSNGFNPAFYKKFWLLVGNDLFLQCSKWLGDLQFPSELNKTNIVLIPKCSQPTTMKDLCPIALCNVACKIMAKVSANRLKETLSLIISDAQSAFVPRRSICVNVLAAFEVIHYMKRKMKESREI